MIALRDRILSKILSPKLLVQIDTGILQPVFNKLGLYNPLIISSYIKPLKSRSRNIFCNANFESPKYFMDIRDVLLEEFAPVYDVLPQNISFLNDIRNSQSVCVHIRRGDFLLPKYRDSFAVCNEEYFVKAMNAIHDEIPDCKFFIFSDDVEFVKSNMNLPFEAVYERSDNPVYETIRLMYSCRHFIMSNSTLSWWAQFLSRNENKIVYAPSPWHWKGEEWKDMYLPYMRIIQCSKN